jgi:hypothetical protein
MEHVWNVKGDGEDNARIGKCASLSKRGNWMSLVDSLPRLRSAYGESKQTSKGGTTGSNWSAKALATNQHKLGGYNYGKSS